MPTLNVLKLKYSRPELVALLVFPLLSVLFVFVEEKPSKLPNVNSIPIFLVGIYKIPGLIPIFTSDVFVLLGPYSVERNVVVFPNESSLVTSV